MKVLFVASEALPFMASGGLGDVAGSLPAALRKRLIGCRVVMPLYDSIPQELKDQMQFITSISVPVAWRRQYCGIFEAKHNGVIYYICWITSITLSGTVFTAIMTMQSALRSLPVRYWTSFQPLTGSRTLFTATTGKAP